MRLRSLLFVPGDRPERMEKAVHLSADALILDLEDSVGTERKTFARKAVAAFLAIDPRPITLLVRIDPLGSDYLEADLDAIMAGEPDGRAVARRRRWHRRLLHKVGRQHVGRRRQGGPGAFSDTDSR